MSYLIDIVEILSMGVIVLMGGIVMTNRGQGRSMTSVLKEAIAWGCAFFLSYGALAAITMPSLKI